VKVLLKTYSALPGNSKILSLATISFSCGTDVPAMPFIDPMKWFVDVKNSFIATQKYLL